MTNFEQKIELHKGGALSAKKEDAYRQILPADDARNPITRLLLQNAFEFREEDRKSGIDSHYAEFNDQSLSTHGGEESVVLLSDRI